MKSEAEPTAPIPGTSWRGRMAIAAFIVALVLGVAAPAALLIWEAASATATIVRGDAGDFLTSTSSPGGFFAPTITSVQTSAGSIAVVGTFSAPRGRTLSIERTNKQSLRLCVAGAPASCAELVGNWPGPVVPTTKAGSVFDFQRSGLTYGNLNLWLMVGLLLSFLTMVVAAVATETDAGNGRSPDCDAGGEH